MTDGMSNDDRTSDLGDLDKQREAREKRDRQNESRRKQREATKAKQEEEQRATIPDQQDTTALWKWMHEQWPFIHRDHPMIRCEQVGVRGVNGCYQIARLGLDEPMRLEPIKSLVVAKSLTAIVQGQLRPCDGYVIPFNGAQTGAVCNVLRWLADDSRVTGDNEQARGLLGAFFQTAYPFHDYTVHGTDADRKEAAWALRNASPPIPGHEPAHYVPPHYLIDKLTGEYVIAHSALTPIARRYLGGTLPHGWLDSHLPGIGWERRTLEARNGSGRAGRTKRGGHEAFVIWCDRFDHREEDGAAADGEGDGADHREGQ